MLGQQSIFIVDNRFQCEKRRTTHTPKQLCRRRVLCSVQHLDPTEQPNFDLGQEVIIPDAKLCRQRHVGFFFKPPRKIEVKQWSKVVAMAASFDAE